MSTVYNSQNRLIKNSTQLSFQNKPRLRRQTSPRFHVTSHFGFVMPDQTLEKPQNDLIVPKPAYGLNSRQISALGLSDKPATAEEYENNPVLLSAKSFYVGDDVPEGKLETKMSAGVQTPGQAPPDLPSLLLDGRIVYIGMNLVPSVTELVISELLWLNYNTPDKPVYVYINSTGSQSIDGQVVAFENEAYAILDTFKYIRPEIYTLVVGQAFGSASLVLAGGKKGYRWSLPNARIQLCPPRLNRSFGTASNVMIKANELESNTDTYVEFLHDFTGKDKEELRNEIGRNKYFTPEAALEFGLIDKVIQPSDRLAIEQKDYEMQLRQSQAMQRGQRAAAGTGQEAAAGV
eukprot:TRINITY_DN46124_c0_g1_i1.p1 TRINITY_DN46124_c0_g1~~TRINITY_DN46124_c0_g1_i1.p1  ORF type:complete len:355 (-),score=55.12 TRINITY_DN46124_c0_g1_i1:161-1204(-)